MRSRPACLALVAALLLAPTGCEWCRAPDSLFLVAEGTVRDVSGAVLGIATADLYWFEDQDDRALLDVQMVGPPELAGTPPGWPAGGPLQGWTGLVRLEDAAGVVLFQARPQRGSERAVFVPVGGELRGDQLRAMRATIRRRSLVVVIETIDDPRVPLRGPVRAPLPRVRSDRSEGGCTT